MQTDAAMVQAIDAETGNTLWTKRLGQADHPSMTPDAKGNLLAVVNGSHLYVVNRLTGELLSEKDIQGCPSAGPAVSGKRIYVPTATGMVLTYAVESLSRETRPKRRRRGGRNRRCAMAADHEGSLPVGKFPPAAEILPILWSRHDSTVGDSRQSGR